MQESLLNGSIRYGSPCVCYHHLADCHLDPSNEYGSAIPVVHPRYLRTRNLKRSRMAFNPKLPEGSPT